jgi:flagellar biosynthetic protein FliS
MVAALLNGVLKHVQMAREAYFEKRHAEYMERISKATAILQGLQKNLNREISADVTDALDEFYRINMVAVSFLPSKRFDEKEYNGVVARVTKMRDAWTAISSTGSGPT